MTHHETATAATYPVRVAARMTGLKPEVLRAWEARYSAVRPSRTGGGSRRYSVADLVRLRLLRDVVEEGHRISRVARLSLADLRALLPDSTEVDRDPIEELTDLANRLEADRLRRRLLGELERRGRLGFAKTIALPLLGEVGRRWERGALSISAEHLVSGILRSVLMSAFESAEAPEGAPKLVFATPSGEPHDLGTLIAALVASRVEANCIFLGADVPSDDLIQCVVRTGASALVLGIVTLDASAARERLVEIRRSLPDRIGLWIGGAGIHPLAPIRGVDRVDNLDQLEAHVMQFDPGRALFEGELSA